MFIYWGFMAHRRQRSLCAQGAYLEEGLLALRLKGVGERAELLQEEHQIASLGDGSLLVAQQREKLGKELLIILGETETKRDQSTDRETDQITSEWYLVHWKCMGLSHDG